MVEAEPLQRIGEKILHRSGTCFVSAAAAGRIAHGAHFTLVMKFSREFSRQQSFPMAQGVQTGGRRNAATKSVPQRAYDPDRGGGAAR